MLSTRSMAVCPAAPLPAILKRRRLHRMAKSQLELDQHAHNAQLEASILQQKVSQGGAHACGRDPGSVLC